VVWRLIRTLATAIASYLALAWWGLVSPRLRGAEPLVVPQAVVRSDSGILLAVRNDLRGWELPGGKREAGETSEEAVRRELFEEAGIEIEIERHVGDYLRSGFRPHTAKVYLCRVVAGELRPNYRTEKREIRELAWFDPESVPATLFPWYREPLSDALSEPGRDPVCRRDHQGLAAILAGLRIDLRMRLSDDRAGRD
jgi:8-oxo-dGTP diphosphatase